MDLIVTKDQLDAGYVLCPVPPPGAIYYRLPYKVRRDLGDGTYLVDYSHTVLTDLEN